MENLRGESRPELAAASLTAIPLFFPINGESAAIQKIICDDVTTTSFQAKDSAPFSFFNTP